MNCDQAREAISAGLDGEEPGLPGPAVQAHLAGCPACQAWREQAHAVTRRARLGGHVLDHDLTASVLAASGPPAPSRPWSRASRVGLVAVALAQLAITVPLLALGHDHDAGAHAAHELGSFDLALAIAFAVGAIRPALSAGLAWPSGIAAAGLAVTAVADVIGGQTFGADEAQHLIAVAGAALLFRQARAGRTGYAAAAPAALPDSPDGEPFTLLTSPEASAEPPRYGPGPAAAAPAAPGPPAGPGRGIPFRGSPRRGPGGRRVTVSATTLGRRRGLRAAAAAIPAAMLAATLVACGGPAQHDSAAVSRPQPPAALGGVTMSDPVPDSIMRLPLTTADGQRTTLAAYRGKIVMIADFLTLCQDMCPMISANVLQVARQVQSAGLSGKVALLEITVDPERDTPARMAAYQKLFGGPRPDWTLLTASTQAGTAALWKFFHVWYQRTPEEYPDATDWMTGKKLTYDVEHSNTIIFLSPDGKQRYIADAAADSRGNLPPEALIQFMTSEGRRNLYHPEPSGSWTAPQALQVLSWLAGRPIPAGGA